MSITTTDPRLARLQRIAVSPHATEREFCQELLLDALYQDAASRRVSVQLVGWLWAQHCARHQAAAS